MSLEQKLDTLFDELITQQERKVLQIARQRLPHLTGDDILNPHDFPELLMDPIFNYEEGMVTGLRVAHTAIRARILRAETEKESFND